MMVKMTWTWCKAHTCDDKGAHYIWDMALSHVIKVEKIKTWLGSTDRLQVWWASQRLWSEGPRVTMNLEQDLAPMGRCNGEEQVKLRSMNQYDHMMIWSGSYHCWSCWCMCCIDNGGDGMECVRQRYNLGHFHFNSHRYVEKLMTGLRIDGRTNKRGKLVCLLVI
jgi:hypothetical protein